MPDLDVRQYALTHGLTYDAYLEAWRPKLTASMAGLTPEERRHLLYSRYNWERSEKVHAAYRPSERLATALRQVQAPQLWVILTEDWCVDGAFSVPVFVEAARRNPCIDVRLLPRDAHPAVMDRYLTNGGRAIPIVVAFDEDGRERFRWGSRSAAGKAFREARLAEGLDKADVSRLLVDWNADGGYETVDPDLAALLEGVLAGPAEP